MEADLSTERLMTVSSAEGHAKGWTSRLKHENQAIMRAVSLNNVPDRGCEQEY